MHAPDSRTVAIAASEWAGLTAVWPQPRPICGAGAAADREPSAADDPARTAAGHLDVLGGAAHGAANRNQRRPHNCFVRRHVGERMGIEQRQAAAGEASDDRLGDGLLVVGVPGRNRPCARNGTGLKPLLAASAICGEVMNPAAASTAASARRVIVRDSLSMASCRTILRLGGAGAR